MAITGTPPTDPDASGSGPAATTSGRAGRWSAEWLRGVLELCVLASLRAGPNHGYALAQQIEAAGLGAVKGGTLYPLLTRLESDGLVESSWQAGDGGPGRKVFALTPAGLEELTTRSGRWREFTRRADRLLPPPPHDAQEER